MRIGALDDEPRQLELVRHAMVVIGHECHGFEDRRSLQRALYQQSFDMLILDWRLPDVDGSNVVRWIREKLGSSLPILFVAKRRKEEDMVEALTLGADDFMAKPIRVAELQARVQALLRRTYPALFQTEPVCGPYRFIPLKHALLIHGQATKLKHREYTLAIFLFRNIGRLLSREHLLEAVWGRRCNGHFALARHAHVTVALEAGPAPRQRPRAVGRLWPRLPARVHRPEWDRVAVPHGGRVRMSRSPIEGASPR
ncbi:DNA-binding response regulator, OmpR family, contains REC and winged-helix (wHTH) domain [Variovorax sp. CF079]|nr:DNA-binding response regulator, OmpR family, contains REC and winged-helix (wHTH) domain [Variovorax sp. CF079]